MSSDEWGRALISEAERRILGESIPRLKHCLGLLSDEEIWRRPGGTVVSAGNYALHLCGNARQWICAGLAGEADHRDREREFTEEGPMPRAELLTLIDQTADDVKAALDRTKPETLLEMRPVQVFEETGLSILVHVVEHFSYHVGQVTYYTKLVKNVDTGYYGGKDLGGKV
jgi:uncharacterized damage-inducible protein DinB